MARYLAVESMTLDATTIVITYGVLVPLSLLMWVVLLGVVGFLIGTWLDR